MVKIGGFPDDKLATFPILPDNFRIAERRRRWRLCLQIPHRPKQKNEACGYGQWPIENSEHDPGILSLSALP